MHRPQPIDVPADASVDALPETLRVAIAGHWSQRASAELSVADSFEALVPRLRGVNASDVVLALAEKAVEDERRHGHFCARLASRYLGRDVPVPQPRDGSLPAFGAGNEELEVALIVLGMCCVNESIASEWIRACWKASTAPTAIHANRVHLQDEIDHARLGWAHLNSRAVTPALRRSLRAWVNKVVDVNVAEWKKPDRFLPSEGVAAHGHLSTVENDAVIEAAVRDIVMPGLVHVGVLPSEPA